MKNNVMKSTILVGTVLLSTLAIGQKKNETSAAVAYKNTFMSAMSSNDLAAAKKALIEAKKFIDLAAEHIETKESPKTLWLKGAIYSSFLQVGMMSMDTAFLQTVGEDALDQSITAFKTGFTISDKYDRDITESVYQNHSLLENISMSLYKSDKFEEAAEMYEIQTKFLAAINVLDSNSIYNAALCYERFGNYEKAAQQFEILAKAGYKGATTYAYASNSYRKAKKFDEAKAIVLAGRKIYPQDKDILLEAVNTSLELNDAVGAQALLTEAIAKDAKNKMLHLTIGSIYIDLKKNTEAETAINEALTIDPNYEDALYQLGAHLVTWAGTLIAESNQLKYNDPKAKVLEKEATEIYNRAIVPLEKYIGQKPTDKEVLTILSQLYRNIGNMEKSAEYKKKVDTINQN
jgi:tetratricopeptide (TPR) repeat protein